MKRSLDFLVVILLTSALAACGPSVPGPAQPTARIEATRTVDQVARAVQLPTTTAVPAVPSVIVTSSSGCAVPAGWSSYTVKAGDTLYTLSKQVNLTPEELMRANCLTSSLIGLDATLYLPLESCTPTQPEGWRLYTVRSGDTLFSLATTRDTTVGEVKRVNCLVSESLEVGKQLYLPPLAVLPPPAAPPVAQPMPAPPPACSVFSCPPSAPLPDLVLSSTPSERPPCLLNPQPEPWIGTSFNITSGLRLGERGYFYACNFPTGPTTATMTLSDGSTGSVELEPPRFSDDGNVIDVADFGWPALPTQPTGWYTLTVVPGAGSPVTRTFHVGLPAPSGRILPVPNHGAPGTIFQVYYVNFPLNSTPAFKLYREQGITTTGFSYSYLNQWQIPITQPLAGTSDKGWGVQTNLASFLGDPPDRYMIISEDPGIKTFLLLQ